MTLLKATFALVTLHRSRLVIQRGGAPISDMGHSRPSSLVAQSNNAVSSSCTAVMRLGSGTLSLAL